MSGKYDDIIGLSGSTDPDGTYHSNTYTHEEYVAFREQMPITVEAGWLYCFNWPDSKNTPVYVRGVKVCSLKGPDMQQSFQDMIEKFVLETYGKAGA